ncbi:MAG: C1 family peptidase, partial [Planctomycetota bacterium]
MPKPTPVTLDSRELNALPDTLDFRDRAFESSLVAVPSERRLEDYQALGVPILDQGQEGACTGFALATVAHYLLRTTNADEVDVSPWMLYRMAQKYDEWDGEDYSGSSARGAMKAWHKHGVASLARWSRTRRRFTRETASDAASRPLGAYLRVDQQDLVAMHAALSEVGILYASATVHQGWSDVGTDGVITYDSTPIGGHAFAIVGYDEVGFWIQNSWGPTWGRDGFARIAYDDWLENARDVWVARLGVPIVRTDRTAGAVWTRASALARSGGKPFEQLRPHIVSLGNEGRLKGSGTFGTTEAGLTEIFENDLPSVTEGWDEVRLLLYAHGGLVPEKAAIASLVENLDELLANQIYPLVFVWNSDYWSTLRNILSDAVRARRAEGLGSAIKDFALDRLDDMLEVMAAKLTGRAQWAEMKENALRATTTRAGGAGKVARLVHEHADKWSSLHVVGHSAGAVLLAPLVQLLASRGKITGGPMRGKTGLDHFVQTCQLWAPACTVDLFDETYRPLIEEQSIERFALFTLTDEAERDDDCARIYNKSLLYLVSNAFESRRRIPGIRKYGTPLLGMETFIEQDEALSALLASPHCEHIVAPNAYA